MQLQFCYDKRKVIQALRQHFTAQKEIKILLIVVNVFAIISSVLFFLHKIQPQPFLLSSIIWLLLLIVVWYILPYTIYKKSQTFKDCFTAYINNNSIRLDNANGYVVWDWKLFDRYFESVNFFHLYFSKKSFFLIPKDELNEDELIELRKIFATHIKQ